MKVKLKKTYKRGAKKPLKAGEEIEVDLIFYRELLAGGFIAKPDDKPKKPKDEPEAETNK